jgi:RND family efflux transporter MFP subunit
MGWANTARRKIELGLLALLAIAVAAGAVSWLRSGNASRGPVKSEAAGIAVPVVAVRRADLENTLTLSAEFRPFQEVNVYAKVSGYVREMHVDVGARVKAGDVLAVLEVPELENDLQSASAAVERAHQEAARAKAAYEDAHLTYERLSEVIKEQPNLIAQQDIDQASSKDQVLKAAWDAAESAVREASAHRSKYATLIGYSKITAPFDGVITQRFADTGSLVGAGTSSSGQALVRLSQLDPLRLVLPVPASVAPKIRDGAPIDVHVQATNETISGTVSRSSGEVSTATRTMHVEVDVRNPQSRLAPGMYATATLVQDAQKNVLAIPIEAAPNRRGDTALVYVLDGQNKIEERRAVIGMETATQLEVKSGVAENELVLVGGRGQYQPGQIATPKRVTQEAKP